MNPACGRWELSIEKAGEVAAPSDDARFRALYDAHHRDIHAYCLRRLAVEDANDAVSEVFLAAWRRLDDLPEGDDARLWLFGVARNAVRNRARSRRRHLRLVARTHSIASAPPDGPETMVIRSEEHAEVAEALESMRDTERELLMLKVWEGLSHADIGALLGISERAVEGRAARALAKLTRRLEAPADAGIRSPSSEARGDAPA